MTYKINHYDEHNPQLEIFIPGDRRVSFTLAGVAVESREWLGEILDRMFHEEIERAVNKAVGEHKSKLRDLLGVYVPKSHW